MVVQFLKMPTLLRLWLAKERRPSRRSFYAEFETLYLLLKPQLEKGQSSLSPYFPIQTPQSPGFQENHKVNAVLGVPQPSTLVAREDHV